MSTDVSVREQAAFADLESAANLPSGSISLVGLELTGAMEYDEWVRILTGLGHVHRWTAFAIGDALVFGFDVFGEDAAAATEGTTFDRYDVAARVTGLHPSTLQNYMSLSARIAKSRRRVELPPSVHEPVAHLEPSAQAEWLQKAVDFSWTRAELRAAIKGEVAPNGAGGGLSKRDRIMVSSEHVAHCARKAVEAAERDDDVYLVPVRVWDELVAALEED